MTRTACLLVAASLLLGCIEPSPPVPDSISGMRFLAGGETAGFAQALGPHSFEFPRDHGPHEDYQTEWWYFTGNLRASGNRHFGFELTFFRYALAPSTPERESKWASRQVWMAHLALTDSRRGRFDTAERLSRGALGLAGARMDRFAVWADDWSATQDDASGPIRLSADTPDFGIDLRLEPRKQIVRHGDGGLDRKGPERWNASYYYSWPRLGVTGTIRAVNEAPVAVTGLAWLDREWGTSALSAGAVGWDWFALQLTDGRDLMFYRLRDARGAATPWSGGTIIAADGTSQRLGPGSVTLDITASWTSPRSRVSYPVEWRLRAEALELDLSVRATIPNQEVDLSVRYWEGAVTIESLDAAQPVTGSGYLELAGYRRE